jgi:hypothetical protein
LAAFREAQEILKIPVSRKADMGFGRPGSLVENTLIRAEPFGAFIAKELHSEAIFCLPNVWAMWLYCWGGETG